MKASAHKRAVSVGPIRSQTALRAYGVATKNDSKTTISLNIDGGDTFWESKFSAANYSRLLEEGEVISPCRLYSLKDFEKKLAQIQEGLLNIGDWAARVKALVLLQGVLEGDGFEYTSTLVPFMKSISELVASQIVELRSSNCREACRTVARFARYDMCI